MKVFLRLVYVLVLILFVSASWSVIKTENPYILMEYTPQDPDKPVKSIVFYTDTLSIQVYFCARYKVKAKEFKKIEEVIRNFHSISKFDTTVYGYYNVTILDDNGPTRYIADNSPTTAKLFATILETFSDVSIKERLKGTFESIERRLE